MYSFASISARTSRLAVVALLTCLALSGMSCSKVNRTPTSPAGRATMDLSDGSRTAPPPVTDLPVLGTAANFAVLGASTVTSTGLTVLSGGDLGVSPGTAITGFGPGVVSGAIHAGDPVAAQAQLDLAAGYGLLTGMACTTTLSGQDLGGMTLAPGVYCFASSAQLTGGLVLDAQGNPDAVFVFQIGSTLTTAVASSVVLINGGRQCNVFWAVGSSATLGTNTHLVGNVISVASITLTHGVVIAGRALARAGAVTMDADSVSSANCGAGPIPPCRQRAHGEGSIAVAGGMANFSFNVHQKSDGRLSGSLQFMNRGKGSNLAIKTLTSVVFSGSSVTFVGTGTRNGVAGTYTVTATSSSSPMLSDRFSISGPGGLLESGNVKSGKIRIEARKCGHDDDGDDDDEDDDDDDHDGGHGHGHGDDDDDDHDDGKGDGRH